MNDLTDTIVAVSSPGGGVRSIVRIAGPQTIPTCERLFTPKPEDVGCAVHTDAKSVGKEMVCTAHPTVFDPALRHRTILAGSVRIHEALAVDALLYLFRAPYSYTSEDLAEIHIHASRALVEALVQSLLAEGLRPAGPGEFTARAYLNGKLDLAQAEAVNEVINSSNRLQLEAAERLLGGRLTKAAEEIRTALLDVLSLIEAGLDFSGEDIEFISDRRAAGRFTEIQNRLDELLAGSIRCEGLLDLPAVGIAGAANAGKSSLLNALLGWERSIVAHEPGTTRDVLTGLLTVSGQFEVSSLKFEESLRPPASNFKPQTSNSFQCILFDCAGLIPVAPPPPGVDMKPSRGRLGYLDQLAQDTALEALRHATAVLFCVDATKADWTDDVAIRQQVTPQRVIHVATKCDLLKEGELSQNLARLARTFGVAFLPTSARTGQGRQDLFDAIAQSAIRHPPSAIPSIALTARHQQAVTEAQDSIRQAITEVDRGRAEIAATMIRTAHQALSEIEQQPLDEQILDRIFSRFCIGK